MGKSTPELIEKAKTAKSVEELLAIAEENEVVLALDDAKTYPNSTEQRKAEFP